MDDWSSSFLNRVLRSSGSSNDPIKYLKIIPSISCSIEVVAYRSIPPLFLAWLISAEISGSINVPKLTISVPSSWGIATLDASSSNVKLVETVWEIGNFICFTTLAPYAKLRGAALRRPSRRSLGFERLIRAGNITPYDPKQRSTILKRCHKVS